MEPKYKAGDKVNYDGKIATVSYHTRLAGEWWYTLVIHDGYYTGDDGSRKYNSKLLKYNGPIHEDIVGEAKENRW